MFPISASRPAFARRLALLLFLFFLAVAVRAANPFLDGDGRPNALFWATGTATLALDQPLYDLAQRLDSPTTHKAAVGFNSFGDGRVQLGAFALMTLVGGSREKRIARRGLHGLAAGGLVVFALKNLTRKSRPWAGRGPVYGVGDEQDARDGKKDASALPGELDGHPDANRSFPSGHTMAAFSLASVWANERPRDRELVYTLATLAGLSRLSLKQHWPSDVFFGAALGMAVGNAANRDVPFGLMFRLR